MATRDDPKRSFLNNTNRKKLNDDGNTQPHESDKIEMNNDDSTLLVKKSGTKAVSASRMFKKKESTTQTPEDDTSLFEKEGDSTIMESKQLILKGTSQPAKDPAGLAKKSGISRIVHSVTRKPKKVESDGGNSGILPSEHVVQNKETAQPHKDSVGLVKNGGTSRTIASKHPMKLRERTQHPKPPVGSVKNIGTSTASASTHTTEKKKKAIQLPKDSTPSVKKIETTAAGVASKSGTNRSMPPKPITHKREASSDNRKQRQYVISDHIMWEGFVDRIIPLGKSCLLCDGDLAVKPEYDPDMDNINPAENAVLSCGHVFHSTCLRLTMTDENCRDPTCIICASILS